MATDASLLPALTIKGVHRSINKIPGRVINCSAEKWVLAHLSPQNIRFSKPQIEVSMQSNTVAKHSLPSLPKPDHSNSLQYRRFDHADYNCPGIISIPIYHRKPDYLATGKKMPWCLRSTKKTALKENNTIPGGYPAITTKRLRHTTTGRNPDAVRVFFHWFELHG